MEIQTLIKCREDRGVIVDQYGEEVHVSVFVRGAHASCFMSRGETIELIAALQAIIDNQETSK